MIDDNNDALKDQFADFGNDLLNDGPDVACGLEKSKGLVRCTTALAMWMMIP
jgi:hypothetical protein